MLVRQITIIKHCYCKGILYTNYSYTNIANAVSMLFINQKITETVSLQRGQSCWPSCSCQIYSTGRLPWEKCSNTCGGTELRFKGDDWGVACLEGTSLRLFPAALSATLSGDMVCFTPYCSICCLACRWNDQYSTFIQ